MQINKEADFVLKSNKVVHPPVRTDGLELYYDTKGKKNSDLHKDKLLDMSGNGRHGELHNFNYKNLSGYQEDSELVFDGIKDTLKIPKLSGIDVNNFTYQLNNNILAFTGDEVKTVKNGDIEVGGINVLKGTKDLNKGNFYRAANVTIRQDEDIPYLRSNGVMADYYIVELEPNATYTLSLDIRNFVSGNSSVLLQWFSSLTSSRNDYEWANIPNDNITSEWKKFNVTFTVPTNDNFLSLGFRMADFRLLKLEKGNKATDWPPAPEDLLETTELKGNILGDMEDIIDDDTRDEQSGVEVFTDKAEDSLVRVEIDGKSVGGGSGKNLLTNDPNYWEIGSVNGSASSGVDYHHTGTLRSPYIELKKGSYTLSISNNIGDYSVIDNWFHTYDNNKKGIGASGWNPALSRRLEVPEDGCFIRVLIRPNPRIEVSLSDVGSMFNLQLEEGSTATDYEPPAPTPDYPIEIHSLNDFDVVSQKSEGGMIDGIEVGGRNLYLGKDGSKVEHYPGTYHVGGNKTIGSDEQLPSKYFMRINNFSVTGVSPSFYFIPFSNSQFSESIVGTTVMMSMYMRGNVPFVFDKRDTIGTDWTKVSFLHRVGYGNTHFYIRDESLNTVDISSIKFEKGNIATDWTPAPEDIKENDNHPLIDKINLLLSEPLRSVGDVKDRLFRDSDGLWKIERNVRAVILNGSESWGKYGTTEYQGNNNVYTLSGLLWSKLGYQTSITSHLFNKNAVWADGNTDYYSYSDHSTVRTKYFRLPLGVSLSEWKNWLSENPVTFQGQLETRVIEKLDEDLQDKLNNLRSFQDSNYVYTIINEADFLPSHISENLKPMIYTQFLAKDHYKESRTVNNLLIWNRPLEDEELLKQNKLFHERFNMRSNTIKGEPINQEINLTQGGYAANTLSLEYTIKI